MNAEYPELEKELKSLIPIRASELLKERIALEMERPVEFQTEKSEGVPSGRKVIFEWRGIAAALLVAAFGYTLYQNFTRPELARVENPVPVESPDVFNPVLAERQVIGKVDEGIVVLEGQRPYMKVRYQMMDHYLWENPRNGRTLTVRKPSEQIIFVGVDMN